MAKEKATGGQRGGRVAVPPGVGLQLSKILVVGLLPIGLAVRFAWGDLLSGLFVGIAVVFYVAASFGLWARARARLAADQHAADGAPSADIARALGDVGLLAPEHARTLRVHPAEALRLCPQLVSEAVQLGWLQHVQALLISLGLVGTFVGLSMGLQEAVPCIDPQSRGFTDCVEDAVAKTGDDLAALSDAEKEGAAMRAGMSELLDGAKLAFSKSIAGVGLGIIYLFALRWIEAELRRTRRAFVLRELRAYAVFTDVDRMTAKLVEGMSGQKALAEGAEKLGSAARGIQDAVAPLQGVATNLQSVSADAIGVKVGEAVRMAVIQELKPTLAGINQQLVAVKALVEQVQQYKVENDRVVTARLQELTTQLRDEVLTPMSAEVQRGSEQTRRAAEAMNALQPVLNDAAAATRKATLQSELLTKNLVTFQKETMAGLQAHAEQQSRTLIQAGDSIQAAVEAAVHGLKEQESAFKSAARQAEQTFVAQTLAVDRAGKASAEAITNAGNAASEVLKKVQDELVVGINAQIEELGRLLRGLKELSSTFAVTDQGQRDALLGLAERTAASLTLLTKLSREIHGVAESAHAERNGLKKLVDELMQQHGKLLQSESLALSQAVTALLGVVNAAEQQARQAAALGGRTAAPVRPPSPGVKGGPHG
ncbi:MAG: hypothetical protein RL071_4385 [Pseudomonadota bacterium]